jgi:hypothetical protein
MARIRRSPVLLSLVAGFVAACASGAAGPSAAPSAAVPSLSASGTTGQSARPNAPIDSPDEAAGLVVASDPKFKHIGKKDPELIGQCCYYEAARGQDGYRVRITMGWGDCPAGCIEHHTWTFDVSDDGVIKQIGESGDPLPPGGIGSG